MSFDTHSSYSHINTENALQKEHDIIKTILKQKASEYLKNELIKSMQNDFDKIASDAVEVWAKYTLYYTPHHEFREVNINVKFVEEVIKVIKSEDSEIKINIENKKVYS